MLSFLLSQQGGSQPITNPALSPKLQGLGGIEYLALFLPKTILFILIAAAVIAFFVLIIGGIRFITSGGDKAATESARGQITMAIIGLVLVFAVFAIMKLLGDFFGLNLLEIDFSNLMIK